MSQDKIEQPVVDSVDYKAQCADLQSQLDALKKHKETLLDEAKSAKQAKRDQEAQAAKAEQERSEKAGEYEKLWKNADQVAKEKESKYNELLNEIKQEKITNHAMKVAIDLAGGNAQAAKLLERFVSERLQKLSDERGNIDQTVVDSVKREFENNQDYAPLLGGSLATGGGAKGAINSGAKTGQTMTREEFDVLHPNEQRDLILNKKIKLID